MNKRNTGQKGEKLAQSYLELIGYTILESNYHASIKGEIDIIAKDGETIVFVEVKLRFTDIYGSGREAVNAKKIKSLSYAAQHYLIKHQLNDSYTRFDVMEITLHNDRAEIEHIKNAFEINNIKGW